MSIGHMKRLEKHRDNRMILKKNLKRDPVGPIRDKSKAEQDRRIIDVSWRYHHHHRIVYPLHSNHGGGGGGFGWRGKKEHEKKGGMPKVGEAVPELRPDRGLVVDGSSPRR